MVLYFTSWGEAGTLATPPDFGGGFPKSLWWGTGLPIPDDFGDNFSATQGLDSVHPQAPERLLAGCWLAVSVGAKWRRPKS